MNIDVLTIFPEMFTNFLKESMVGIAVDNGAIDVRVTNIRDFAADKHKTTDDYPYGGGAGMVMKPEPIFAAVNSVRENKQVPVIYFTPQGKLLTQDLVNHFSRQEEVILLCGHYKEIDQRIRDLVVTEEISIGDYVLSGGEIPAMVFIDAVARLQEGVLGDIDSALSDSHQDILLGCPYYTRPADFKGLKVPEVLLSGNHARIAEWRKKEQKRLPVKIDLIFIKSTLRMKKKNKLYLGLVHYPVQNKFGETVTTSITNLDIHDISRSCRTFGVEKYFIINHLPTQEKIFNRILDFWQSEIAGKYNSDRVDALNLIQYADSIETAGQVIRNQEGKYPILITTTAAHMDKQVPFDQVKLISDPILLLFGTGNGLTDDVHSRADLIMEPIRGDFYNHLSVRSAVAIVLDRLTSEK